MYKKINQIKRFFNRIRYRFFGNKHHIIKTSLEPSDWYDTDHRMLYAVMDLVKWYVENDMLGYWTEDELEKEIDRVNREKEEFGWTEDFAQAHIEDMKELYEAEQAILEIVEWWNKYSEQEDAIEKLIDAKKYKEARNMEEKLDLEEQEMLMKAIKYRRSMWS
jgi:hypothetical protein